MADLREPISTDLDEILSVLNNQLPDEEYGEVYRHQLEFFDGCHKRLKVLKHDLVVSSALWSMTKSDKGILFEDGIARGGYLLRTLVFHKGQTSLDALPENTSNLFFVTDDQGTIVETLLLNSATNFH